MSRFSRRSFLGGVPSAFSGNVGRRPASSATATLAPVESAAEPASPVVEVTLT
jgi:hypothetical protein